MTSRNKYIDFKLFRKIIAEKKQYIDKLQEEYEYVKTPSSSEPCDNLEALNSEYSKLKAETEVLESSEPNIVPNCKPLLFAWAHQILREDVKNLEELRSFQKDMKRITFEKKIALRNIYEREQIDCDLDDVSFSYEDLLENERTRSEILECLHKKLIRRLRRVSRQYFPAVPIKEGMGDANNFRSKKLQMDSMFSILQELLIELKDNSVKPNVWEETRRVIINGSQPEDYILLLLNSQIVELTDEDPVSIKLVTA